jgi:hypothetical protein
MPGGATLARAYGYVGRVRRSRHPAIDYRSLSASFARLNGLIR